MFSKPSPAAPHNDLQRRFPNMRPVKSPPSLFTINSFGLGMYGRRDFDRETGTYIKTRCLCAVFIPIFPLDSYRVADAQGGGWYFIGREKGSGFTRAVRWCVLVAVGGIIGMGAWNSHLKSPGHRAKVARETAKKQIDGGKPLEAAEIYHTAMRDNLGSPAEWPQAIGALLETEIGSGDPARAEAAIKYAEKRHSLNNRERFLPDLANRAMEAAAKCTNPADAAAILSAVQPTPTELVKVHGALRNALEKLHLIKPDDHETRIKLALMREEVGEVEGALGLLEPAADKLGDGEGARLYGKMLLDEGRVADALPHLERYVDSRSADWKKAQAALERAGKGAYQDAVNELNRPGGAPPGFKKRYDAATEDEQGRMVDEFAMPSVEKDRNVQLAREHFEKASEIAGPIMDLGVARLKMAQVAPDAATRSNLLKKSEEAFLSLQSVGGENDAIQLFLGQIYFWTGREAEGRQVFDKVLAAKSRNAETLTKVAGIFRSVGEENEARKLLEEAFPKAKSDAEKASIVSLRSMLCRSNEESIEWLSKAPASPEISIKLAVARGHEADAAGNAEAAKRFYREALAGYEKTPRDSGRLNNSALLYRDLYRLEGKRSDFETSARLLAEAVELSPADSILSVNAGDALLTAAVLRVVGEKIDPRLLQMEASVQTLSFLYERESEKTKIVAELKSDPNFRKAVEFVQSALLLAPKNVNNYAAGLMVFGYLDDVAALENLCAKAAEQDFDFAENHEEYAKHLRKENDAKFRDAMKVQTERANQLVGSLNDPRAKAMALSILANLKLSAFTIGDPTGVAGLLSDLRRAAKETPCSRIQSTLEGALQIAALEKLATAHPECAAIIEADRRHLDASEIFCLLIRAKGELGEKVRKEPLVVEAREAVAKGEELFPASWNISDWLLCEGLHPERDAKLKELASKNRSYRASIQLMCELQEERASSLLRDYWRKIFDGDAAGAQALLPQLEKAGLKLPPLS